jgi:dipeptide transport system permease protein
VLQFIFKRIIFLIPTLLGASFVAFFLIRIIPGDPVTHILGERGGSPEQIQQIRERLGLDRSLVSQYFLFIRNGLQGDFGNSIVSQRPVTEEFGARFPATLELALVALLWSIPLGLILGIIAAVNRKTLWDLGVVFISLVGYSMPIFWWGLLLILFFSVGLGWFPVSGRVEIIYDVPFRTGFLLLDCWGLDHGRQIFFSALKHLALPSLVLGTVPLALVCRMTRTSLLEVLQEDFIRTARAKGALFFRVMGKHALKNILVPLINMVGVLVGSLVTGAFLTESLFSWPGLGRWLVKSIEARDYPVLQGGILYLAFAIVLINFIVDFLSLWVNPRLRRAQS